jgi:hypothetical protein
VRRSLVCSAAPDASAAEWRALWGDDYVSTLPRGGVRNPLHVVVTHLAGCARALSVLPETQPWYLTLDLDFFSTRNPALRSLPFQEDPSFCKALWRLARTVPVTQGDSFHRALLALAPGSRTCFAEALAQLRAAAVGTPYESAMCDDDVRDTAQAAVARFAELSAGLREAAYSALLRAHLADHQSTEMELDALLVDFAGIARTCLKQPHACFQVLIARSEMYTTKRQAKRIRDRAVQVLKDVAVELEHEL